jgi:uncharacterized protein YjbI with pentapeptide repeats
MSDAEKAELRRANDNPWYCLATLYGEQPAGDWDQDLVAKNRTAWNRWMAARLSDEQRTDLVKNGLSESELVPLTPEEKSMVCSAFASRVGREKEFPPNPTEFVDFTHTHFDGRVTFGDFLYAGYADFKSATFSYGADFRSATFSGGADFSSATFSDHAFFNSATFSGLVFFNSATFTGGADFSSATFSDHAFFNSATFSTSAMFSGGADFRSATFSFGADFISATFSFNADFRSAMFSGHANFRSATFSSADFSSATFSRGRADFINAEFTANTVFADVRFGTDVPDFRGATMHEATEWHGVKWPPAPQDKHTAQVQVYAYERLKQEMERLKKHEDEQFFFRRELRARRGLIPPGSGAWLLNYVYEASSDYGQSIDRPLLWLFGLFATGSSIFAGAPVFNGTRMTIRRAAGLSFANIFSFLPINREIMTADMVAGLSSAARIVGVVQSQTA